MAESSSDDRRASPAAKAVLGEGPARSKSQSFSDILTILMRTEPFRDMPLKDLEWLVVPPLKLGQFALAHATQPETDQKAANDERPAAKKPPMPVGVVMWANVSEDVDRKLRDNRKSPLVRMEAQDWSGGDIPWIIVAAGMPQVLKSVILQTAERVFEGRQVHIRVGDGKTYRVEAIGGKAAGSGAPN